MKDSKVERIRKALRDAPHGLWIREISRKTGLDKSTISRYLIAMHEEIEFEFLGRNKVYRIK
ncbi:MAG TPA: helix-turn-helix domain-containing protein [archaeon]|nr:helix-turn-helix domain-containing protein [archaeon]